VTMPARSCRATQVPETVKKAAQEPALIAHIVYRFDYGGLENGLANLVSRMPGQRFRHAVICLAGYGEDFVTRIDREKVAVISIDKRPGKDFASYGRLWRLLKKLSPDIVHTRNLGTVDLQWVAFAAGVPHRVHGEHGWTSDDPKGLDPRKLRIRRACRPVIQRYVAMSRDIAAWLRSAVGVPEARIRQLYNGVDTGRFRSDGELPFDLPWTGKSPTVIGTVGRLDPVKNQLALLRVFGRILEQHPELKERLRLIIAGDGPERSILETCIRESDLSECVWMPGARDDVAALMRAMDLFVLPSVNEGISNTILEAMASGLPVVAGRVGGNPELVEDGKTGSLYPGDSEAELADAILRYVRAPDLRQSHGRAARARVLERFSLESMVEAYADFYDELLNRQDNSATCSKGRHATIRQPRTTD
jgi:sugar transferase (PEP-CTERM/EpsH1 system associated)